MGPEVKPAEIPSYRRLKPLKGELHGQTSSSKTKWPSAGSMTIKRRRQREWGGRDITRVEHEMWNKRHAHLCWSTIMSDLTGIQCKGAHLQTQITIWHADPTSHTCIYGHIPYLWSVHSLQVLFMTIWKILSVLLNLWLYIILLPFIYFIVKGILYYCIHSELYKVYIKFTQNKCCSGVTTEQKILGLKLGNAIMKVGQRLA